MENVLVATDLSDRSDIAVARAVSVARSAGANLHVLHVVDSDLPLTIAEAQREGAQRFIKTQLAKNADTADISVNVESIFGTPSDDIVETAQKVGADLTVMGRHRPKALIDFFRGTTVERVARTTKTPLLVVTRPTDAPYTRAVVGIDFSDCATNAITVAAMLVGEDNLMLVHAYRVPFKAFTIHTDRKGALSASDRKSIEKSIREEIDEWAKECGFHHEERGIALREGSALDILPLIAGETGTDLICVGAHSRAWLSSAILGSTGFELLTYCDLDILITPL